MTKPITPKEVVDAKATTIPSEVFEAFNELIAQYWNGYSSTVKQDEVVKLIKAKRDCDRNAVFDSGWLDVEDVYRKAGWDVEYDKPGYNETYLLMTAVQSKIVRLR